MAANLKLRHKVIKTIRNFLDAKEFLEVETPILGRATPEGARDFLVPSRSEMLMLPATNSNCCSICPCCSLLLRLVPATQLIC